MPFKEINYEDIIRQYYGDSETYLEYGYIPPKSTPLGKFLHDVIRGHSFLSEKEMKCLSNCGLDEYIIPASHNVNSWTLSNKTPTNSDYRKERARADAAQTRPVVVAPPTGISAQFVKIRAALGQESLAAEPVSAVEVAIFASAATATAVLSAGPARQATPQPSLNPAAAAASRHPASNSPLGSQADGHATAPGTS
ncbi:hypothetical protein, partial [Streptomyces sp. NPDC058394]|uniref:hypothetical protein n=1 Tax=Streptomyces sp. NPDC058394 TaxID=3346477 RepID=UPI00365BA4E3